MAALCEPGPRVLLARGKGHSASALPAAPSHGKATAPARLSGTWSSASLARCPSCSSTATGTASSSRIASEALTCMRRKLKWKRRRPFEGGWSGARAGFTRCSAWAGRPTPHVGTAVFDVQAAAVQLLSYTPLRRLNFTHGRQRSAGDRSGIGPWRGAGFLRSRLIQQRS